MFVNNSRLVAWQSCHRKFAYSYIMGLVPRIGSDALALGTGIHAWLGGYYAPEPKTLGEQHDIFESTYRIEGNPDYIDEFESNLAMGHRLIDDYANRNYVLDDFAPVQVESQFSVPIGDICWNCGHKTAWMRDSLPPNECFKCGAELFNLVGRADLIATRNNRLVVIDHKSAKGVGERTMKGWSHDFGLIGYCYGVDKSTEFHVTQFGVNIIKKLKTVGKDTKVCPSCRNGKRKRLLCTDCEQSGYVAMDPPKAFYRDYFRVTAQDYHMFEQNRIRLCKDILAERDLYKDDPQQAYPMNCKSCESYSGCPFVDICWEGDKTGKWWDIPPSLAANFNTREDDYVDSMVKEELE